MQNPKDKLRQATNIRVSPTIPYAYKGHMLVKDLDTGYMGIMGPDGHIEPLKYTVPANDPENGPRYIIGTSHADTLEKAFRNYVAIRQAAGKAA